VRIISGTFKGRRLVAPKQLPVRPTTDMAKEALFNILNNQYYFDELAVLDLFAGTGNISYEFASRGTEDITAVDNFYGCIKFIQSTSESLEMPIKAVKSDVFTYLKNTQRAYDIVFADPPYNLDDKHFKLLVELILEGGFLNKEGLCIIEHSKYTTLENLFGFREQKRYGGNCFSFFKI